MHVWPLKDKAKVVPVVRTARLVLRPAQMDDFLAWQEVRGRNQEFLKPYEPAWPSASLTKEFFARRAQRLMQDWLEDRCYAFLIFDHDQKLLGGININNVVRGAGQYAALGYWLDEDAQGKGIMREAAQGVLHYAFTDLHLERMNAATLPHNHKSMNMLRKLGFAEEGYAKAYIQIDGKRQDHVLFGLNAADFLSAAGNTR